jgi:hypothetical protein
MVKSYAFAVNRKLSNCKLLHFLITFVAMYPSDTTK